MLTIYLILIHNKTGVEIYRLNSRFRNECCFRSERKALKVEALSAHNNNILDDHNTKRILNASW